MKLQLVSDATPLIAAANRMEELITAYFAGPKQGIVRDSNEGELRVAQADYLQVKKALGI